MRRVQFAAWSFVLVFLFGLMVVLSGLPVESSDFYDFYLAAVSLQRGADAYAPQANGVQGFFNPLWAAFPFVPLAAFEPAVAFQMWRLIVIVLLLATLYPLMRLYRVRLDPVWAALIGWLVLLPWFVGQNAPLVAAGAFLAIAFAARAQWARAGALMPLLAIKPQTVPLFPIALLLAGRRPTWTSAFASLGIASVSAWLVQFDWLTAWLTSRWGESQAGGGQTWLSSGLVNVLEWLHWPIWLYPLAILVALGLFWRYHPAEWRQCAAMALGLGAVSAPYIRAGDFPLLLPMFFLLPKRWVNVLVPALIGLFLLRLPVPLLWLIPAIVTSVLVIAWERGVIVRLDAGLP